MLKRKSKKESSSKYELPTEEQLIKFLSTSGVQIKDPARQVTILNKITGANHFNKAMTEMLKAETELLRAEIEYMPKHERRKLD